MGNMGHNSHMSHIIRRPRYNTVDLSRAAHPLETAALSDPTDRFGTRCVHTGQSPEATMGAIIAPVFQTSTGAKI